MNLLAKFSFSVVLILACAAGSASAYPLILAQPTSQMAFSGDASATFQVIATGTPAPTLQWQVKNAVPPDSAFVNVTGATGATLTIPSPGPGVDGNQYRCVVTSGASIQSAAATLKVYPSPFMSPPAATVSPATVAADSTANITITVTSLPTPGATVRIERILDLNANGTADIGEPLVQSFLVKDGQATWFGTGSNDNSLNAIQGGIRNPNVPGDDDTGIINGKITTHISLPTSPQMGRTAGSYLIRISDPSSGMFRPITRTLAVTQPTTSQSVSGQVTDGSSPIPHAIVTALRSGNDFDHVASTVADASGNYTLNLPVGNYTLMALKAGFVASMPTAPSFSLSADETLTGKDPVLTPATCAISGTVRDASNFTPLRGVQLFAESSSGDVVLTSSDSDGNYSLSAGPGQWWIQTSESSLAALGYLNLDDGFSATPTAGETVTLDIPLTAATAMIYGTVRDPSGNPLPGVAVEAGDDPEDVDGLYDWTTFTNAEGKYFIGVSSGAEWRIEVNQQPAIAPHVMPPHQWRTTALNGATQLDFSVQAVTAHIRGTVTTDGSPLAGIVVWASSDTSDVELTATTDASGAFDLGVVADTWWFGLDDETLIYESRPPATLTNGQAIEDQNFTVLAQTGTITGTVVDPNNNPFSDEDVYAYTQSGTHYEVSVEPGPDGSFSLPVLAGIEWWVGSDGCGDDQAVTPQPNATVTIIGSAINGDPNDQTVPLGANASFSVEINAPSPTIQWQRLPVSGETGWVPIEDDTTYSGANTANLTVSPATAAMTGDQFRCAVTYTFNGTTPITNTSDSASLYVVVAHLTGTLVNNGVPVAGASVSAFPSFQWPNFTVTTDTEGHFDIPVTATGTWHVQGDSTWAAQNNMLASSSFQADVSAGTDVTGIVLNVLPGTGTITGNVKDSGGNNIANAFVYANTSIGGVFYNVNAQTNAGGNYSLPVVDGTWNVGVSAQGVSFAGKQISVVGSAQANFTAATAHFQGTMTNNGTAVPGMAILAVPMNGNLAEIVSTTTDASGNFDLAVTSGSWAIRISQGWANWLNLVGPSIYQNVDSTPTTISGIAYPVLSGTATIYGNVRDASGNPVANTNVWASTTIDGVEYNGSAYTDASGAYSFPSLSGRTWWVDAAAAGYSAQQIAVSGLTEADFGPSPHSVWDDQFTPSDIATGRTGLTADFDRDGVANLIEYAFGKNPKAADSAGISEDVVSGKMQISFPCDSSRTDIIYTVQASSNLTTWTDIATSVRGATTAPVYDAQSNPLSTVSDTGTGLRTVTVADASAAGSRRFLRVKVSDPALPLPTPTPYPPPF